MSSRMYKPTDHVIKKSYLPSIQKYKEMYERSLTESELFWTEVAQEFQWHVAPKPGGFMKYNFDITKGRVFVKFMEEAELNVCYNLLDRNVKNGFGDKIAFFWEGNSPDDYTRITYRKLLDLVCQFANGLLAKGIRKGDRVAVYMPMILEAVICMLACARIGAVHTVVFAGFSSDALAERLSDAKAKLLVTADGAWRGERMYVYKRTCDDAIEKARTFFKHRVDMCMVVNHLDRVTPGGSLKSEIKDLYNWNEETDIWWHEVLEGESNICPPEWVAAEDPLFVLYTSGSTGKPKGVVHTTAGYLMYAAATFRYVFDYHRRDVYWCTADVGWITGHTYVVYAPLANAATSVMFEGTPYFPKVDRYWSIINKYKVTQFYTAPTAIRALMAHYNVEDGNLTMPDLSSLRVLGSVGEPINPAAWLWYYTRIGKERCSIVDTFWQTETGGHVITGLPGATPMKPGAAGFPFFGVEPKILNEDGVEIEGPGEGYLVFARPWPGMMRTLLEDQDRFERVYFSKFPGYYCTGDGVRRDEDGYLWITGRIDDMLNVSGHLMSTAEVEGVLASDPRVSEAAVVPKPHEVKGEALYCFVVLKEGLQFDADLVKTLTLLVRQKIGAFAAPDTIQNAPGLPKTRSGKIMRRILRKIAVGDHEVGDISTLADPGVVEELFNNRPAEAKPKTG
ncbi:acetyl-coenzyme A synthetase isoform X2 [Bombyx mori]|uniref:Acetyl-coenzyme A synthetase n=1 Tax=Bombyx mori TaxID=7091 RepID=A0A8R2APP1_BOMMO|nr:acetyl-coenzyme A synthetase isoform X2 [Bombyx mori]